MRAPLVLCLINEAWFFRSHFLPWATASRAAGFDVRVIATPDDDSGALADGGIAVIPSKASRGGLKPTGLLAAARQVASLVERDRPTLVHAFGLHGMAIAALARRIGVRPPIVASVTGLGFVHATSGLVRLFAAPAVRGLARALDGPTTIWLTENAADAGTLGLAAASREERLLRLVGAGVDLAAFSPRPMPALAPLRLILVARMIRSKGVDVAVAAVAEARRRGIDVRLTLVGAPDPANPRAYSADELAGFAGQPGISALGARGDVADLLGAHHAFILPSRGGEGLPKSLLEAAAAGRPAIVSDVPGCRDFVRHGSTGWIVPAGDVGGFADAIGQAAVADLATMGAAARAEAEGSAGIGDIAGRVVGVYRRLFEAR